MPAERPLLPAEFEKRVLHAERPGVEPAALAEEVARLSRARHPGVAALDPDAFPAPMAVALHLYRHEPGARQGLVMSAVGRGGSPGYWERLAAAARDAYAAADFVLLGALAFRADLEYALVGGGAGAPLLSALGRLLQPGGLAEANRVRLVFGYLRFVPAAFVIPRDLGPAGGAPAPGPADWPLLRLAWGSIPDLRAAEPGLPAKLAKAPNRFVREAAAAELAARPAAPAPRAKPPKKNPFAGLAGGVCRAAPSAEDAPPPPPARPRTLPTILRPPPETLELPAEPEPVRPQRASQPRAGEGRGRSRKER